MIFAATPMREAPTDGLLNRRANNPSYQTVIEEGTLQIDSIQGLVLNGFNKDYRQLISYRVNAATGSPGMNAFKTWLRFESQFVATAAEVIAFNRLFKATRDRRNGEGTVKSTWLSLSLSHSLLNRMTGNKAMFADVAFTEGLAKHSKSLGDPFESDSEYSPKNWFVGGEGSEADLFAVLESDIRIDLLAQADRLATSISALNKANPAASPLIETLFVDEGENLPPPLSGHEHFGFLDGISQPGIRGLLSHANDDPLTPRQNPSKRDASDTTPATKDHQIEPAQGKPGQDLLHPGEFVFGYPRQSVSLPTDMAQDSPNPIPGPNSLYSVPDPKGGEPAIKKAAPEWAKDGSFLVYRRLRQEVGAFHKFLLEAGKSKVRTTFVNDSPSRFVGSQLVGRWPSGCPVMRSHEEDIAAIGNDDCANNNFEFGGPSPSIEADPSDPDACSDSVIASAHTSEGDVSGGKCPFTSHIRKAYPRDDESISLNAEIKPNESDTQTHRLLRRGLPYGPVSSSSFDSPDIDGDKVDRGLQFLCFQTSIDNQFEFVIKQWINNTNFKEPFVNAPGEDPKTQGGGIDPILGQNRGGERVFNIMVDGKVVRMKTEADWVHPTAGGYFFTPSVVALTGELTDV